MKVTRLFTILGIVGLLFVLVGGLVQPAAPAAGIPEAAPDRLVLAFYYAWFGTADFTTAQMPDIPVEPYNSDDRATIERQVDQAKVAGIDGFILAWEGPGRSSDQNLVTLLAVAQQKNFGVSIYFETRFFTTQDRSSRRSAT